MKKLIAYSKNNKSTAKSLHSQLQPLSIHLQTINKRTPVARYLQKLWQTEPLWAKVLEEQCLRDFESDMSFEVCENYFTTIQFANGIKGRYKTIDHTQDNINTSVYNIREVFSYRIARSLGFHTVPPTTFKTCQFPDETSIRRGSIQLFCEGVDFFYKKPEGSSPITTPAYIQTHVLDYIIGQCDRFTATNRNCFVDQEDKSLFYAFDNAWTFGKQGKTPEPRPKKQYLAQCTWTHDQVQLLRKLDPNDIFKTPEGYPTLEKEEQTACMDRLDIILDFYEISCGRFY